jgi:hypothetical protein
MAFRHGMNSRVYIAGAVVKLTRAGVTMTRDRTDVSGFGDGNKYYVLGKKDLSISISGFWDDANDALFDAADATGSVPVIFYPDFANAPAQYMYGPGLVDASIESDSNGAVGISGTIVAADNWTRVGLA